LSLADAPEKAGDVAGDVSEYFAVLRDRYGLHGRLTPIATERDETFRLDLGRPAGGRCRLLVKVAAVGETQEMVSLQTSAMKFIEHVAPELPVQRVYCAADGSAFVPVAAGSARTLRVLEWVEGSPLAEFRPWSHRTLEAVAALHARTTIALAGFSHDAAMRVMIWDVRRLPNLRPLLALLEDPWQRRVCAGLLDRFEATVTPQLAMCEQQVVHADVSPYNVIMREVHGRPAVASLIDFGDVVYSALVCDLAVPLANCLDASVADPWADAAVYLRAYCALRPLRPCELDLFALAAPGRLLQRILLTAERMRDSPQRGGYLRTHAARDWVNLQAALAVPELQVREALASVGSAAVYE
jgi:hydroxylysine kinase